MEATTKELRLHTRELISATDRGEEVIITYRGKRRAKLVAWSEERQSIKEGARNPAFGLWQNRSTDSDSVNDYARSLRQPRKLI
ncbi:Antitoxin component of toxin-antitoxin stability system, DNA-binding transcriptional repressor [Modicisalibacter ilicicola DSM 19980]|uniref:Antitoxin component of toxin-antitoxin stability system, DNA-binding transcriptional repressor n=1 Tax=Modicisalibacter ilicicola DSM 19980 TaxID=1121942 RepID=A0A1M4YXF5_9GAMM|nr:prevent-host-death family protein [Halomonas ilicicola]SHF10499.1 Antitoxin component of toxin-antitoxin stability system, DNA-binding transcriptional repressor [Halomonas ilicicola DSM 19980]